jgi:hypothetical protein
LNFSFVGLDLIGEVENILRVASNGSKVNVKHLDNGAMPAFLYVSF